jgi:hypothetical protein
MGRISLPAPPRPSGDRRALTRTALFLALALPIGGCGTGPTEGPSSTDSAVASAGDSSGFSLPPGFKTVDIPLEKRKEVFKEAHDIRALAVQEANLELPMDEAHLPHLDTKAFEKRVADHKAIIDRILGKNLPVLAEKYKISVADIEKIEDEANKLRWLPPADPVFKPKGSDADSKTQAEKKAETEPASTKSP